MAKPRRTDKRRASPPARKTISPPPDSGTRRKFLKMAGAVTAAMLVQSQAKGITLPSGAGFTAKWLEAVRLEEAPVMFNMTSYYVCCDGDSYNGVPYYGYGNSYRLNLSIEQQRNGWWCWITVALSIAQYFGKRTDWSQCNLYDAVRGQDAPGYTAWGSCCEAPNSNEPCQRTGAVDRALDFCEMTYNIPIPNPVDFNIVAEEIIEFGRPVVIHFGPSLDWGGQPIYHFEVITGVSCIWDSGAGTYVGAYDIMDTNGGEGHLGQDSRNVDQLIAGTRWDSTIIGIQPRSEY